MTTAPGGHSLEHALRSMGDEALGVVSALLWSPTLPNAANQTFMKLAEAKLGRATAYFNAVMYSSGRWIIEAAVESGRWGT